MSALIHILFLNDRTERIVQKGTEEWKNFRFPLDNDTRLWFKRREVIVLEINDIENQHIQVENKKHNTENHGSVAVCIDIGTTTISRLPEIFTQ